MILISFYLMFLKLCVATAWYVDLTCQEGRHTMVVRKGFGDKTPIKLAILQKLYYLRKGD